MGGLGTSAAAGTQTPVDGKAASGQSRRKATKKPRASDAMLLAAQSLAIEPGASQRRGSAAAMLLKLNEQPKWEARRRQRVSLAEPTAAAAAAATTTSSPRSRRLTSRHSSGGKSDSRRPSLTGRQARRNRPRAADTGSSTPSPDTAAARSKVRRGVLAMLSDRRNGKASESKEEGGKHGDFGFRPPIREGKGADVPFP
jgi:hypothetical protein